MKNRYNRKRFGGKFFTGILLCFLILGVSISSGQAQPQATAAYDHLVPDAFLTRWLVLGPVPITGDTSVVPDEKAQRQVFDTDPPIGDFTSVREGQPYQLGEREYRWRMVAPAGNVVDLDSIYARKDYVFAYAWAEVNVSEAMSALMALGSDDGVKVWVNGKLIHEQWVARPLLPDEDLFAVHFRPGSNQILVKVQDIEGDWGFALRPIGPAHLGERMVRAAGLGDLDLARLLLDAGVDIEAAIEPGLTALQSARIHGRKDMVRFLQARGAATTVAMPAPQKLADAALRSIVPDDGPGAAVLVARDGEILYAAGAGLADMENHIAVTPHTKFRIGSVTKQFTAAAVLTLQEQGKLNVRDPLSKYLPGYPRGDEVTIHHLLTHTSGVHSYTEMPGFMESVTRERTSEQMVTLFRNEPLDFTPGEAWHYSNSGYFLLGYLVEKITGESYAGFVREHLLAPAGMSESGMHQADSLLTNVAYGYAFQNGAYQRALNWHMSQAGGAGALYSTVRDLYRWNEAIFNGKILSDASLRMAFTPVVLNNGQTADAMGTQYGYGWQISSFRGVREISHGGGLQGFVSSLLRFPEIRATVVVLHNCAPARDLSPDVMAHNLAEFFFWEDLAPQASFTLSARTDYSAYDEYAGLYEYPMGAIMEITRAGNRLFAQLGGQSRNEIFPRSRDEFFWKVADAQISFQRNENGEVVAAIHRQGGREFRVPKMPGDEAIQVNPAVFKDFTGEYELSPGAIFTVSSEGGHLYVQLTNQPRYEVFPRSDTEYFYKVVKADIAFIRDASGKVSSLVLTQGPGKYTAKKIR